MNRAGQLFAAIVDDPDDDEARLVYADLLHEGGDPRGEFIQVQCALARDAGNRNARISENKLLEAHGAAWRAEIEQHLPELMLAQLELEFRRGFIEHATIGAPSLRHLDALLAAGPLIRSLRVVPGLPDMTLLPRLPLTGLTQVAMRRIRELDLRLPGVGNNLATLLAAAPLEHLTTLTVKASVWGEVAQWYKRPLSELSLDATGCAVLASALPSVTRLSIAENRIERAGVAAIAHGRWRLVELDVGENAIDGLGDALAGPALAGLDTLRIAHARLTPDDAAWLVTKLPALRDLDVERCDLGAPGTQALCDALATPLRRLRIERNSLGDAGAKAIAGCARLASLRDLEMGHNRIGHKGASALATSPHLHGLERLTLNEPRWKPETKEAIAASHSLDKARVYLGGKLVSKATKAKAKTSPPAGSKRA